MRRYLDLNKLNKFDWKKYFLLLIEDPKQSDGNDAANDANRPRNDSPRRPRTTSHYNLNTISKAMDMSA